MSFVVIMQGSRMSVARNMVDPFPATCPSPQDQLRSDGRMGEVCRIMKSFNERRCSFSYEGITTSLDNNARVLVSGRLR